MFYSQFILAKKGPLGTIWIAAHLERKLRKNQVADTDIGVSVDSILFPDVPIALRLSSHLLLGVVRIYSKKVNYLFHDCSEALLKIKQAFRSTAVDLPPEESTAPYNSITLPETFDLDNFELPDSAFLDRCDFVCAERFGDEDTSQIGLELDEELFMDKNISLQHNEVSLDSKVSGLHMGENSVPSTSMTIDAQFGYVEEKGIRIQNVLSELLSNNYDKKSFSSIEDLERDADSSRRRGYNVQTPDLNEVFLPEVGQAPSPNIPFTPEEVQTPCVIEPAQTLCAIEPAQTPGVIEPAQTPRVIEPAQAPSTPGLFDEVMPSNFEEVLVNHVQENDPVTSVESGKLHGCISPCIEMECAEEGLTTAELGLKSGETTETLPSFASDLISPMPESVATISSNVDLNTTNGVCFVSRAENHQGVIGNVVSDYISTTDHMLDGRKIIVPSVFALETSILTSLPKEVPANSSICTDNIDVGEALLDGKMAQLKDSNEPSGMGNQSHLEDIDSCLTSNISVVGSDFHVRSDGSSLHPQSSIIDGRAFDEPSEMPTRDYSYSFKTPMREELQHLSVSSFEVQVDHKRCSFFRWRFADTSSRDSKLERQQASAYTPSVITFSANKQDELSTAVPSEVTTLSHLNYSSSGFQEPEKMLASVVNVDFPIYQGMQTVDRGVTESDGSVDRVSSHYNRKRRAMDSAAIPETGSSAKLSGIPRSKKATDNIPDDDDILASILVGRKDSALITGPTTSISKASLQKRPRGISRGGILRKRKVLVDDAMVLHADAIRQQLINTEDIRRIRKKAPCTRPDIWWIYMGALEDEMFDRSMLTGISEELNSLISLKYGVHAYDSRIKISGEAGPSRVSEFVNETGGGEIDEGNLLEAGLVGGNVGPSSIHASEKMESQYYPARCHQHVQFGEVVAQLQVEPDKEAGVNSIMEEISVSDIDHRIASAEKVDSKSNGAAEILNHNESHNLLNTTDIGITCGECANVVKVDDDSAALVVISESSANAENAQSSVDASIVEKAKIENFVDAESLESSHPLICNEVDTALAVVNILQDTVLASSEMPVQVEEAVGSAAAKEGDCTVDRSLENGERPAADVKMAELSNVASFPSSDNYVPSAVGENNFVQEVNLDSALDIDSKPVDVGVVRDSSDFCSAINDNYTGFLNVDDEPDFDEAENDEPNPEVVQSLENYGWSARTRGVARYLKNLFDEECGHGMKSVAVDRLLAGKTRKEASRMFFETLVLKTRDYIEVEQEKPFEYVKVMPRMKLLKSEF
ncbi:hypothetical protein HPP92_013535 [Vanilla planifolia]|uniref:Sister chromatid cohesion 1 protein 4-like n=1 Tax=Vanilla planifolia TaxID=51239 RepID=A0A835UUX3_VANPL|nr:hypothetical protein HPP92_013535 [Vanilla planifolia]